MLYFFNGNQEYWETIPTNTFQYNTSIPDYGECVFETLRTYHGDQIFALGEHLDRLFASAEILRIDLPPTFGSVDDLRNKITHSLLDFIDRAQKTPENLRLNIFLCARYFWISSLPLIEADSKIYTQGVEIKDETFERSFPQAKYPNPAYKYFLKSQPPHIFETIFFDRNNFLREGNISNVFAVIEKTVVTPKENVLFGVTRSKVLELAKKYYPVEERNISRSELEKADEIFITNTSKEVVPIRRWGTWKNTKFPVAKKLKAHFSEAFVEFYTQLSK